MIGEIESVEIIESSGSVAFDKTAIEAFSKTGTLLTLKGLENSEYRDFFRKFIIQFEAEGPPVPGVGLSDEEFVNSLPSHNGHIQ